MYFFNNKGNDYDEEDEIVNDDVPETLSEDEQVETNASEGVDEVQETTEEVVQPETDDIEKRIEERANQLFEEKIETRLTRDRIARERKSANEKAKYTELENIMKTVLGADNLDDVITKSREYYSGQGVVFPEVIKSGLNERDEMVLARADAEDIIRLGKKEMEDEANRIASIPDSKRSLRDKTIFNEVCKELVKLNDESDLRIKGYDVKLLSDKEFISFREQFNVKTPISQIVDMYKKINSKPVVQPKSPGSARTSNFNNEVKEYYTPEEARRFTDKDLDNPKLMEAIEKSMQLWSKNK